MAGIAWVNRVPLRVRAGVSGLRRRRAPRGAQGRRFRGEYLTRVSTSGTRPAPVATKAKDGEVRGGKRERNKAENRAAILEAARRVFADLGYEAATVRDVIGATDLASGTFYNYFPDKESVLRAVLGEELSRLNQQARAARSGADTVEEIVRRTYAGAFSLLAADRVLFDLLRRNAGAIRAVFDEPAFVADREDLRRDLEKALARQGAKAVDAEYLTAAISGVAFEVAACAVDRQPPDIEAATGFATAMVLGGLAGLAKPVARIVSKSTRATRTAKSRPNAIQAAPTTKKRT